MDKNRYFQIRSGKYIKTKVADIQRLYSKWLWLVMAVYKPLLTVLVNGHNPLHRLVHDTVLPVHDTTGNGELDRLSRRG